MKHKRIPIKGSYIYLIGLLLLTVRYPIAIHILGGSKDFWKSSGMYLIIFTPFVDYILHFILNPLMIPVFDWWYNREGLRKNFGSNDVLICLSFLIELIVLASIGLWFMQKTSIDFANIAKIITSPPYLILWAAFIGQMVIFLKLRAKNATQKEGLKKLMILPIIVYGLGLLLGVLGILFIAFNPHS